MKADEAIKRLQEKFKSGNNTPVTRAAITLEEFESLKSLVYDLVRMRDEMEM